MEAGDEGRGGVHLGNGGGGLTQALVVLATFGSVFFLAVLSWACGYAAGLKRGWDMGRGDSLAAWAAQRGALKRE